ncbi:hypothetical protein DPMN_004039 [Dreissena polymorpha]|uniref:Uncharacterized protein n=1 Tax=Dreissena polymorpha TaxID=45954 RepID=A0A9D4RSM1_DREPO|nr:hypothetical protein DPMN_004039 [Dreissena polymorpha]
MILHQNCCYPGSHVFQQTVTIFELSQAINTANLRTNKAAPPPGGHIFQQTETIFKLSLTIIKTNVQTKFHEDWTINVTPRVLISKTALPPGETNVLTKFHEDWTKNVTSLAFTCFHYIHIEKTALPPGGHVFSPIWTFFELLRDINKTNILTKFHDVWAKMNTSTPPGGHVFQRTETIFELNQHIINRYSNTRTDPQTKISRCCGTLTLLHEIMDPFSSAVVGLDCPSRVWGLESQPLHIP